MSRQKTKIWFLENIKNVFDWFFLASAIAPAYHSEWRHARWKRKSSKENSRTTESRNSSSTANNEFSVEVRISQVDENKATKPDTHEPNCLRLEQHSRQGQWVSNFQRKYQLQSVLKREKLLKASVYDIEVWKPVQIVEDQQNACQHFTAAQTEHRWLLILQKAKATKHIDPAGDCLPKDFDLCNHKNRSRRKRSRATSVQSSSKLQKSSSAG